MTKIKNREELSDFLDILDEFIEMMIANSALKSSTAVNTFLEAAKGEVAKHKVRAPGLDHHSTPIDTYEMIIKQPKNLQKIVFKILA